jgi:hypothetical protein
LLRNLLNFLHALADVLLELLFFVGFQFAGKVFSQVEHADQANDNEVDCHNKVEQARHDQN